MFQFLFSETETSQTGTTAQLRGGGVLVGNRGYLLFQDFLSSISTRSKFPFEKVELVKIFIFYFFGVGNLGAVLHRF